LCDIYFYLLLGYKCDFLTSLANIKIAQCC